MKWLTGDPAFVRTLFRTCSRISLLMGSWTWNEKEQQIKTMPHSRSIMQHKANPDLTGKLRLAAWTPLSAKFTQVDSDSIPGQAEPAQQRHMLEKYWVTSVVVCKFTASVEMMVSIPPLTDLLCPSEFLYLLCSFLESVIGIIQVSW